MPSKDVQVFQINSPISLCPSGGKMGEWQRKFPACQACTGMPFAFSEYGSNQCWLPYSKNAEGKCFAYDAANIGWWKVDRAADDDNHYDDPWTAEKGGVEVPFPTWAPDSCVAKDGGAASGSTCKADATGAGTDPCDSKVKCEANTLMEWNGVVW